jgi:hypothetical protein
MRRQQLIAALKRAVLVAALILVASGAVLPLVLWLEPDPITRANFNRIKDGMRRAEVEAILGPPGDYTTGPVFLPALQQWAFLEELRDATFPQWYSDTAWISIALDESRGVVKTRFAGISRTEYGGLGWRAKHLFGNLGWRVNRLWRRWFPS